ncbi:MAG: hypothetical protein AAFP20_17415 [Cyanobacteria bacterium J06614_10]
MLRNVAVYRLMQYLYYFANTSLVLRLLNYLSNQAAINLDSVTVIYLVDRWVVRVKLRESLVLHQDLNFTAFLRENGSPYTLTHRLDKALACLDRGMSCTEVMNRYHVVIVSHGDLRLGDIEEFRTTFVQGLGYCPPSLV